MAFIRCLWGSWICLWYNKIAQMLVKVVRFFVCVFTGFLVNYLTLRHRSEILPLTRIQAHYWTPIPPEIIRKLIKKLTIKLNRNRVLIDHGSMSPFNQRNDKVQKPQKNVITPNLDTDDLKHSINLAFC